VTENYEVLVFNQADLSKHASELNNHFQIKVCRSFELLIELTLKKEYHFILIDVQLNGAESIEVLKKLNNHPMSV